MGNNATVKDLTDMQKYFKVRMEDMQEKGEELYKDKNKVEVKVTTQLEVIGAMVERYGGEAAGTFRMRSDENKKKIVEEQMKQKERINKLLERQQQKLRQEANDMLEEKEKERQALEAQKTQSKGGIFGMSKQASAS